MRVLLSRIMVLGVVVPLGLTAMGIAPAFAQFGGTGGAGPPNTVQGAAQRNLRGAGQAPKTEAAPPVLPGTKGATEAAAPTKSAADMTPTEALFDAINRGDLEASRGAVNRGANLNEVNSLGLTPLDLSVDLGRNEISFMLLSQRGDDTTARRAGRGSAARDDARVRDDIAMPRAAVRRQRIAADAAPASPVTANPRYYSGSGGAPIPGAGFLGFNGR